jgi:hypothetical protein
MHWTAGLRFCFIFHITGSRPVMCNVKPPAVCKRDVADTAVREVLRIVTKSAPPIS